MNLLALTLTLYATAVAAQSMTFSLIDDSGNNLGAATVKAGGDNGRPPQAPHPVGLLADQPVFTVYYEDDGALACSNFLSPYNGVTWVNNMLWVSGGASDKGFSNDGGFLSYNGLTKFYLTDSQYGKVVSKVTTFQANSSVTPVRLQISSIGGNTSTTGTGTTVSATLIPPAPITNTTTPGPTVTATVIPPAPISNTTQTFTFTNTTITVCPTCPGTTLTHTQCPTCPPGQTGSQTGSQTGTQTGTQSPPPPSQGAGVVHGVSGVMAVIVGLFHLL
uniref:ARAD1B20394p n=1 Tax=Blastobotrys adeninivorans TaxID=409370 RepID=A0A060T748_BLAAD